MITDVYRKTQVREKSVIERGQRSWLIGEIPDARRDASRPIFPVGDTRARARNSSSQTRRESIVRSSAEFRNFSSCFYRIVKYKREIKIKTKEEKKRKKRKTR